MKTTSIIIILLILCGYYGNAQNTASPLQILDEGKGKVEVADIDNDGIHDIIKRGDQEGESLVLFKYDKKGGSKKYVLLHDTNFRSDRIALEDIDRDGDLDVVTALGVSNNPGSEEIVEMIWIENPLPKTSITKKDAWKIRNIAEREGYIKDIDVADFDRDGKWDVVARTHERTVIYFQQSSQDWSAQKSMNHESHEGMDIGDLDKDGDMDIVLNGFWFETPEDARNGEYKKHIFDVKWFTPVENTWRDNNSAIKVADMNQDGLPDILISHSELPGYPISLYMANSPEAVKADQWKEIYIDEQFDFCQTLDAADIDNDGDLDVLAAKFQREPGDSKWVNEPPFPIAVYYNENGDALTWRKEIIDEDGMYAGILGDVGTDGDMDILGPRSYYEGPVKLFENKRSDQALSLDEWSYIQVDDSRDKYVIPGAQSWWSYFGLDMTDVNRDGYTDIISGDWFYRNPGGDMSGKWDRITFPIEVDAMLTPDVDGDEFADVIGQRLPEVYWLEANDKEGNSWSYVQIGTMPQTDHANTQQYALGQLVPGGKPEIILGDGEGLHYFEIPDQPNNTPWPKVTITTEGGGYGVGDIDQDGYIDVIGDIRLEGKGEVLPGTVDVKEDNSMVSWWKNPGDGSNYWQRFEIGFGTMPDRFAVADLNGDGKLDAITSDERYPGNARNAYLTWYEQTDDPAQKGWEKHIIVTSKSMNSMDAADIDRDGDIDIVVGEHEMPGRDGKPLVKDEKVIVFENDGKGNFTPHTVDQGKESHLGTQLADMDSDGDLDIVSMAWREPEYIHLWRNDALRATSPPTKEAISSSMNRKYSIPIMVEGNGYARTDKPVEISMNLTDMLKDAGIEAAVSTNSFRLVETNLVGKVVQSNVPFQFEKAESFDPETKALGTLLFILQGTTAPNECRHFHLYFDDEEYAEPVFKSLVSIEDIGEYEGYPSYKIQTPTAEYFYHITSSGFASIVDKDGHDWVSYHPNEEPDDGSKGRYRGIPNVAPIDFHPGSPEGKKPSQIIAKGPLKISLLASSEDEQWKARWDIYPQYATMTMLERGDAPYWMLYEGTPGGEFNVKDYWVRSDGTREVMEPYFMSKNQWTGHLPSPKWVYFGDQELERVMYYIHHENYEYEDVFWHFGEGGMTVFGFGRGPNNNENWQQLTAAPAHLTVGFAEKNDFAHVSEVINSAYKALKISVGKVMKTE